MKVNDFYTELFQEIKSTQVSEDDGGAQEQIFTQLAIDLLADTSEPKNQINPASKSITVQATGENTE